MALWGIFGDLGQRVAISVEERGLTARGGGWWGLKAADMKLASKSTWLFSDFLGRERSPEM